MYIKHFGLSKVLCLCIGLLFIVFSSCNNQASADGVDNEDAVEANENDGSQEIEQNEVSAASDTKKNINASAIVPVYNLTQVDSPPLFDAACKTEANPGKCSEEKILKFIKKNAKFPKRAGPYANSLEQVLIVIEKDGSLSNTKYVASGNNESCSGCQQAAVDVVGMMDKWVPAYKDGKAVATRMTIPIKFEG